MIKIGVLDRPNKRNQIGLGVPSGNSVEKEVFSRTLDSSPWDMKASAHGAISGCVDKT